MSRMLRLPDIAALEALKTRQNTRTHKLLDEGSTPPGRPAKVDKPDGRPEYREFMGTLPWPPSMNDYWVRNKNGGLRVCERGVDFRKQVAYLCRDRRPMGGRLFVTLWIFPPDNRRRDVDNIQKPVLDALQHGGVFFDDGQIDVLLTMRKPPISNKGEIRVHVRKVASDARGVTTEIPEINLTERG
jgi:crossover junction endodeoxyribonuclease RusA